MNLLILVVDDEPDVEMLFRQQFRHDLRAGRFTMDFAQSAPLALQRINDAGDRFLAEEIAASQECDHGFLPLLGDDGLFNLAGSRW